MDRALAELQSTYKIGRFRRLAASDRHWLALGLSWEPRPARWLAPAPRLADPAHLLAKPAIQLGRKRSTAWRRCSPHPRSSETRVESSVWATPYDIPLPHLPRFHPPRPSDRAAPLAGERGR